MKNSKPKIPFSLIVKEAGLDRAARWMPFAFASLLLLTAAAGGFCTYFGDATVEMMLGCPAAVSLAFVASMSCYFGLFEFLGAIFDFINAWLRLRKIYS